MPLLVIRSGMLVAALLCGAPAAFAAYLHLQNRKSKIKGLPQPETSWVLGNLPGEIKNMSRRLDNIQDIADEHGPTWTMTIPLTPPIITTTDPAIVEHILKTNFDNYVKGRVLNEILEPMLGNGIFNVDGEIWHKHRKLSSNIFTAKNFRTVITKVIHKDIHQLIRVLSTASTTSTPVDLHLLLHAFTLDTFSTIGFGQSTHCLDDPTQSTSSSLPFARAFDALSGILIENLINPFHKIVNYMTGKDKVLKELVAIIDTFAYTCISNRRKQQQQQLESKKDDENNETKSENQPVMKDLLDLFMAATDEHGQHLTDIELRHMILNMILAGRDTTAQALSWAFYVLAERPDVVEKIRMEFDMLNGYQRVENEEKERACGDDEVEDGFIPAYNDISAYKYTTAVFYEVLRLYPSVPVDTKQCVHGDILPGNIVIPPDTIVNWSIYSMGRSKTLWGPTAREFIPERFLNADGSLKRENPYKFPVFNAGPRTCLGQNMATGEAVMVLGTLLQKFDFVLVPGQTVTYDIAITLRMKNPLMMHVIKR